MCFSPKILVVDDELEVLSKLYIGLLNKDYKVEASLSAEEIIPRIKRFKPNLLIISKELPGLYNNEIFKTIKEQNLTTIMLVNNNSKNNINFGDYQIEKIMEKPVDMDYLFSEIENFSEI